MDRSLRFLGIGAGVRTLGMALFGPFLALFLHYDLSIGYVEIGVILVTLGALPIPAAFVGGLLTDRWGRRRLFLASLAIEAGLVGLLGLFMMERSLAGVLGVGFTSSINAAMGGPALSAYVADLAAGSERTKGFTWFRVGSNAGFAAGSATGGFLIPLLGFGETTLVSSAILFAGVSFLVVTLAASPYDLDFASSSTPDRPTTATPGSTTGGPISHPGAGPHRGPEPRPASTPPPPSAPRRPSVVSSLRTVGRDRGFLLFCVAAALAQITIGQWSNTLQLFVIGPMHLTYTVLGLGLSLNGLIVVLGQTVTTHRVLGRRLSSIFAAGLALYVVAFLALGLSTLLQFLPVVVFFAAVAVLTVGENLTAITLSTLPSNLAPRQEIGSYNGGFNAIVTFGGLLGTFVGTFALASLPDPLLLWVVLVTPSLPAALLLRHAAHRISKTADRA